MRRYRLALHPGRADVATPDSAGLLRALVRADRAVGAPRPRLRPQIAEAIDYARSDPLRLRDAYGLVFPDLDYRRLERRGPLASRGAWALVRGAVRPWRLEEVVTLDPRTRRALLEALARSRWARREARRGRWVADLLAEAA